MKFCYLDESGKGEEPVLVLAGLIVDSHRMHKTKEGWQGFLEHVSKETKYQISELHTKDLYSGNGPWRKMAGPHRAALITAVIEWIGFRKHQVTFAAIDKAKARSFLESGDERAQTLSSAWLLAAGHCALSLQKFGQTHSKTSGHSVLIFDQGDDAPGFSKFIHDLPSWADSYYGRKKKQDSLSHIVDVPFFVDSEHALLVQVADLIAYVLRAYCELKENRSSPKYKDESEKLEVWAKQLFHLSLKGSFRFPAKGRCSTAQLFWDLAPDSLRH